MPIKNFFLPVPILPVFLLSTEASSLNVLHELCLSNTSFISLVVPESSNCFLNDLKSPIFFSYKSKTVLLNNLLCVGDPLIIKI